MTSMIIDYEAKTKVELVALCKERGIKGYEHSRITKGTLIKLLTGEIKYKEPEKKEYWTEKRKESFKIALKKRQLKNNLFDYLTEHNSSIITKYAGNSEDLKTISHSTMLHYKWKCENYSECSNTFEARPRDVFRDDKRPPTKYCSICSIKEKGKTYQKNMLKKNGSIEEKIPDIINVWSKDNKFKSNELTGNSHERIKLQCPNKSAKHPEYEISVYNIQESNCFSCPKCSIKTSKAEMRIYSELKYVFKDVKWLQKIEDREADIIVEDLKLVIEVDGFPWHRNKSGKDLLKNSIFEKNGYSVLRIRDIKLEEIACDMIICDVSELLLTDYNKIIKWINTTYKYNINIIDDWKNVEYYKEIQAGVLNISYDISVEYLYPASKDLWDYEKNYPFIPSNFTTGSHMEVWIKCKNGHSYKKPIHAIFRTKKHNKKHILNCAECIKPKLNKRIIQIHGIIYKSILEFCRTKNISKSNLYEKMKKNKIDYTNITNIKTFIEANLDSLIKK
jgi:very-short-patch-repair endonuclease